MRVLVIAAALTVFAALPRAASAEDLTTSRPVKKIASPSVESQLPELLHKLGVDFISRAHAVECTREGETCTSDEQCCSGLECSGGPPATCAPED